MNEQRLMQAGQPGHLSDILAQVAGALAHLVTDDEPLKQVILDAFPDLRREALRLEQIAIEHAELRKEGLLEQIAIARAELLEEAPVAMRIASAADMDSLGPTLRPVRVEGADNILILPVVRRTRWPVQDDAGDATDHGGDAA
jgi:hypothetical protein